MIDYYVTIQGSWISGLRKFDKNAQNAIKRLQNDILPASNSIRQVKYEGESSNSTTKNDEEKKICVKGNYKKRRNTLLKILHSLPQCEHLLLTVVFDKKKHPILSEQINSFSNYLKRFRSAFSHKYPKGYALWKLEMDEDQQGLHFHFIVHVPGENQIGFSEWATSTWERILESDFPRLVDVSPIGYKSFGYLASNKKKYRDMVLFEKLKNRYSFGIIGKKNMPLIEKEVLKVSKEQMEKITNYLSELAIANSNSSDIHQHLYNLENGCFFHVGLYENEMSTLMTMLDN